MCIPPHQYFFLSGAAASVYCVGVFKDSQDVIGANLLENFMAVFQYSPSRLGIARAPCDRASAHLTGNAAAMTASAADIGLCASMDAMLPQGSAAVDGTTWILIIVGRS